MGHYTNTKDEMYWEYNILTIFAHNYGNKINSHYMYIKFVKEKQRTRASNEGAGGIFGPFVGIHALTWRYSVTVLSVVSQDHLYSVVHRVITECRVLHVTVSPISLFVQLGT